MSKRINDKRRAKADKKAFKGMPKPHSDWVGAILAILLEERGKPLFVSAETLQKYRDLKGKKFPEIIYDEPAQGVMVRLPETEPDNSVILTPDKEIIAIN